VAPLAAEVESGLAQAEPAAMEAAAFHPEFTTAVALESFATGMVEQLQQLAQAYTQHAEKLEQQAEAYEKSDNSNSDLFKA
jgi:hypothetical protein